MGLAAQNGHMRTRTGPKDAALRKARVCYNHLAGDMGTRLFESFSSRGFLLSKGEDLILTEDGKAFVREFDIDIDALSAKKAPLCKECLDWSERRSHLAGSLGRAMLARFEDLGWAMRHQNTRIVTFSQDGERHFIKTLCDL